MTALAHEGTGLCRWRLAFMALALAAALLVFAPRASAQATVLEVFTLKYRTAEQVIPLIQPMLRAGAASAGCRTSYRAHHGRESRRNPAHSGERGYRARRLVITVRQDADGDSGRRAAEVSGSVRIDDHARITVPGTLDSRALISAQDPLAMACAPASSIPGRWKATATCRRCRCSKAIRVYSHRQSGAGAAAGGDANGDRRAGGIAGGRQRRLSRCRHRFLCPARVTGDRVTLDINPRHDTLNRQLPGAINTQNVATTVSDGSGMDRDRGLAQDRSRDQSCCWTGVRERLDNRRVLIKVDEAR